MSRLGFKLVLLADCCRDWGPAFMPAGIWQPAYLVQLDGPASVYVKNSDFDLYRKGQLNNLPPDQTADWIFNASVDVVGSVPRGSQMRYTIADSDSHRKVSSGNFGNIENGGDVITGIATLKASDYELWWPNGLGPQRLYNMEVEVVSGGRTIASVNKRMGFRTIVLNMEPISDLQLSQGITNGSNCKTTSLLLEVANRSSPLRDQRPHFLRQRSQLCAS